MSVSESVSHPVLLTPEPPRKKEMKDDTSTTNQIDQR